jgi:hypothetical protein
MHGGRRDLNDRTDAGLLYWIASASFAKNRRELAWPKAATARIVVQASVRSLCLCRHDESIAHTYGTQN